MSASVYLLSYEAPNVCFCIQMVVPVLLIVLCTGSENRPMRSRWFQAVGMDVLEQVGLLRLPERVPVNEQSDTRATGVRHNAKICRHGKAVHQQPIDS
jgi:hypothetical protein